MTRTAHAKDTYPEFMEKYNTAHRLNVHITPDSVLVAVGDETLTITHPTEAEGTPFIHVHGRNHRTMILNPILGFEGGSDPGHLCVDAHSFILNESARAGVLGLNSETAASSTLDSDYTSFGWPAAEQVCLMVGEEGVNEKKAKTDEAMALVRELASLDEKHFSNAVLIGAILNAKEIVG